jgi:uncharacterized protein YndB with AHSA1/START domain
MERSKITIQARINEDREKVWDYYTNPAHIIHWNFADPSWHCPAASNDLTLGGRYFARMEAKDGSFGFDFEAIYKEIKMRERFTYEFGDRLAEVNFKEENGKTIVTITFDPELENPIDLQRDGWQAILNNFKTYTESL